MREIEVELRAKVKNILEIKKKLIELGAKRIKYSTQRDIYYRCIFDKNKKAILRIRYTNKSAKLTIKINTRKEDVGWIEKEMKIRIECLSQIEKMLELGLFNKEVEINKIRETYKINEFEINIDRVQELGYFIEIEKRCKNEEEIPLIKKEIAKFLNNLGIKKSQLINKGYVKLMLERDKFKLQ